MIKNELEYQTTQELVKRFQEAIAAAEADEAKKTSDPQGWQMTRDVLQVHLEGLLEEIAEYEHLTALEPKGAIALKARWLTDLPEILIKARIAANLTQEELAAILGIAKKKISFYEKNKYALATFTTILYITAALSVELESATFAVDFAEVNGGKGDRRSATGLGQNCLIPRAAIAAIGLYRSKLLKPRITSAKCLL